MNHNHYDPQDPTAGEDRRHAEEVELTGSVASVAAVTALAVIVLILAVQLVVLPILRHLL